MEQALHRSSRASGIRLVTESMPGARSVAVGAWIGVGSRFETPEESGVSHFLEHMLFKGTPTRSPQRIAEEFDGLGGEVNAATGKDYTVVYARVLDDLVGDAFEIVSDMLQRPAMAELEQEREVVLEEIAMYEDDPQDKVHDLATQALFPGQAMGRPVIGFGEVVGSVTADEVRRYHASHYTSPNVVVAAAGHVDHETLGELCDRHLGELAQTPSAGAIEPAVAGGPRLLVEEKPTEQYHLSLSGPGLSRSDDRRHAMQVLDVILGGAMSSRLFQEVREKRGLAYSVGSYTVGYADTGQLGVYVGTRGDNLGQVCEIVRTELLRLGSERVSPAELRRAKDHLKGRLVLGLESPGNRMNRIGRAVLGDTELLSVDEIVERIEAVGADDLQGIAEEHWDPAGLSGAAIGTSSRTIADAAGRLSTDLADAVSSVGSSSRA